MVHAEEKTFHGPHRLQNWPFRHTVINYISKNPSSAKGYQNLIQTCKYFFIKNPVIAAEELFYIQRSNSWITSLNEPLKRVTVNFANASCKFWITRLFETTFASTSFSPLIPMFYRCDAIKLRLRNQDMLFKEFLFLCSNAEYILIYHSTIKNQDGSMVSLEKLVKALPKLKDIIFHNCSSESSITSNTVKELLTIPHLLKMKHLTLYSISEPFDVDIFFEYIKKNNNTKFYLHFCSSISDVYKNRVEAIVNEIIEAKAYEYKPPYIWFRGIHGNKWQKINSLYQQF